MTTGPKRRLADLQLAVAEAAAKAHTTEHPGHRLYWLAEVADRRLSATIHLWTGGKRDRWTLSSTDLLLPDVRQALNAHVQAGDAWLAYLRADRTADPIRVAVEQVIDKGERYPQ